MFCKKDENGNLIRNEVLVMPGEMMTKQSHKDECDINQIMKQYKQTGTLAFREARQAEYLAVPEISFHEAMNALKAAENTFNAMPSHLRKEFKNDPGAFMDFIHDPKNNDRSIELGLREAPEGWIPPAERVAEPLAQPAETPPETAP